MVFRTKHARGAKRQPKGAAQNTFKPVVCQLAFVIKGGFGKGRPHAIDTVEFKNEHYVKMHKTESWLCHAVAGKAKGLHPLRRTTALDTIAAMIAERTQPCKPALALAGQDGEHDCMADLGLDGPPMAARSVQKQLGRASSDRPVGKHSRCPAKRAKSPALLKCESLLLQLPPELRTDRQHSLQVLTRAPTGRSNPANVWVATKEVPFLVAALHRQWVSGGVDFCPDPVTQRKPYFLIRDRAWQVRARLPSGEVRRKSFTVHWSTVMPNGKRSYISQDQFAKDKEATFHKAVAWQAAIEAGETGFEFDD